MMSDDRATIYIVVLIIVKMSPKTDRSVPKMSKMTKMSKMPKMGSGKVVVPEAVVPPWAVEEEVEGPAWPPPTRPTPPAHHQFASTN